MTTVKLLRIRRVHLLFLAVMPVAGSYAAGFADMILINGKVLTVDDQFSIVEAVAVAGGVFTAVGSNLEINHLAGPETQLIDLQGKTVIPGFIDGHAHLDREGLKFVLPALHGARSIRGILDVVAAEVAQKKPGEWIVTMPLGDYPYFDHSADLLDERRYPTRWDLDKVAPENPVYIKGAWYYWSGKSPTVSIANSYALRLAGITKDTVPPHAGVEIGKDASSGEPNGIFKETGATGSMEYSLMQVAPRFTPAQRLAALKDSMHRYNAVGTTSVYEGHGLSPVVIRAYKDLWESKEMTVRSHLVVSPTWDASPGVPLAKALGSWALYASGHGLGDHTLRISGLHVAVGESVQDVIRRQASANPGWAGYSVDSVLPAERGSVYDLFYAAAKTGLRINAITYNEATLEEGLAALEKVNREMLIVDRRMSFQHLSFVTEDHMARLKALGVVPVVLPNTAIWKYGLGRTKDLPDEAANDYLPLQSFVAMGIPFVFATDNVPIEPMKTLWGAIARKDLATGQVVVNDQRISRADALRAFTINGAYLTFEEDRKGSIEVGKLADFAVLSADVLTVPVDEIYSIRVLMTVVGGTMVYRAEN